MLAIILSNTHLHVKRNTFVLAYDRSWLMVSLRLYIDVKVVANPKGSGIKY